MCVGVVPPPNASSLDTISEMEPLLGVRVLCRDSGDDGVSVAMPWKTGTGNSNATRWGRGT